MNYKVKTRKVAYIELNEAEINKIIEESIKFHSCINNEPPLRYVNYLLFGTRSEKDMTLDNFLSSYYLWDILTPTDSIYSHVYQTKDNCRSLLKNNNMVLLDYLKFKYSVVEPILETANKIYQEVDPNTIILFKFI